MGDRLNIGLMVANIEDVFSNSICKGAISAAEELDANLIIFPGKYLDHWKNLDSGQAYEYQYNTLFSYAKKESIDVIVACISSIGYASTLEKRIEVLQSYEGIPILTVASKEEGYPYVEYDNRSGLEEAMKYLIHDKKLKKIGMLAGITSNADAMERLQTYLDVMNKNNIPVKDEYISYGNLTRFCENEVNELLDHNPDLEALICTNDDMAIGAYEFIKRRGLQIGKDILVIGFDDIPASSKLNPPLATVRADAIALGYQAIYEAHNLLHHGGVINKTVKTKFVPRESVGYDMQDVKILNDALYEKTIDQMEVMEVATLFSDYVFYDVAYGKTATGYKERLTDFLALLFKLAKDDVLNINLIKFINMKYKNLLENELLEYADASKLMNIFENIMNKFFDQKCNPELAAKAHQILSYYSKWLVEKLKNLISDNQATNVELNHITNIISRDMLMFDNDAERSYYKLIENLPMLDIRHSYIYLFEEPKQHLNGEVWVPPEKVLLKAYYDGERTISVPRTRQKMDTSRIFRNHFMEMDNRVTLVAHDIYTGEYQHGLFVCDIRYEYFHLVELLTYQLSAAVKIINLFQVQKGFQSELEESLEQIMKSNIKLDRMSKVDELSGLLNRRGFFEQADSILNGVASKGKYVIALYADLDYLKQINDEYGHDEGDFAIITGAKILEKVFCGYGVVGRLGGDEFSAIGICEEAGMAEVFRKRIESKTEEFNRKYQKSYHIHLSVGACEFEYHETLQLRDMMNQADDLLYDAKKSRKKI